MEKLEISETVSKEYLENRIEEYFQYYKDCMQADEETRKAKGIEVSRLIRKEWKDLELKRSEDILRKNSYLDDYNTNFIREFRIKNIKPRDVIAQIYEHKAYYEMICSAKN